MPDIFLKNHFSETSHTTTIEYSTYCDEFYVFQMEDGEVFLESEEEDMPLTNSTQSEGDAATDTTPSLTTVPPHTLETDAVIMETKEAAPSGSTLPEPTANVEPERGEEGEVKENIPLLETTEGDTSTEASSLTTTTFKAKPITFGEKDTKGRREPGWYASSSSSCTF